MTLRQSLAVFLAVLLVVSLEAFIFTSVIGDVQLGETVNNAVRNLKLSPELPNEVKENINEDELITEINSNLERTGIYQTINSLGKASNGFAIASAILIVGVVALAFGSSLLILGIVGLVVGLPFLILGAFYSMVQGILFGALPPEIESFAQSEITSLLDGVFAQFASYLLLSLILGGVLILAWIGYKIIRRVHKKDKSKEVKKENK